jgi:hypothetical protein
VAGRVDTSKNKWWEAGKHLPNMHEIHDTPDFLAALGNAGTKLVIVDYYAQWCAPVDSVVQNLLERAKEADIALAPIQHARKRVGRENATQQRRGGRWQVRRVPGCVSEDHAAGRAQRGHRLPQGTPTGLIDRDDLGCTFADRVGK